MPGANIVFGWVKRNQFNPIKHTLAAVRLIIANEWIVDANANFSHYVIKCPGVDPMCAALQFLAPFVVISAGVIEICFKVCGDQAAFLSLNLRG